MDEITEEIDPSPVPEPIPGPAVSDFVLLLLSLVFVVVGAVAYEMNLSGTFTASGYRITIFYGWIWIVGGAYSGIAPFRTIFFGMLGLNCQMARRGPGFGRMVVLATALLIASPSLLVLAALRRAPDWWQPRRAAAAARLQQANSLLRGRVFPAITQGKNSFIARGEALVSGAFSRLFSVEREGAPDPAKVDNVVTQYGHALTGAIRNARAVRSLSDEVNANLAADVNDEPVVPVKHSGRNNSHVR